MSLQRYQDAAPQNVQTFPSQAPPPFNPRPRTRHEFQGNSRFRGLVVFFDSRVHPGFPAFVGDNVAVDLAVLPDVVLEYTDTLPAVTRFAGTRLLRSMDPPFTRDRLELFRNSPKQWRGGHE